MGLDAGGYRIESGGNAERMAKDVHKALIESVRIEAGIDEQAANSYIDNLLESRRYQRDVY